MKSLLLAGMMVAGLAAGSFPAVQALAADTHAASRTPAELSAMRAIKQALDPLHLMNPGKVFDL